MKITETDKTKVTMTFTIDGETMESNIDYNLGGASAAQLSIIGALCFQTCNNLFERANFPARYNILKMLTDFGKEGTLDIAKQEKSKTRANLKKKAQKK